MSEMKRYREKINVFGTFLRKAVGQVEVRIIKRAILMYLLETKR